MNNAADGFDGLDPFTVVFDGFNPFDGAETCVGVETGSFDGAQDLEDPFSVHDPFQTDVPDHLAAHVSSIPTHSCDDDPFGTQVDWRDDAGPFKFDVMESLDPFVCDPFFGEKELAPP